jgi:hypothetical protein
VQREDDRDRAIDRALRQSLSGLPRASEASRGASMSAPDEMHVDGETLAAWSEGQLRADATARLEQHVSDCARCQHLLATFARTAPAPMVAEPLWRRWHLQWLVPVATAATVAAIWVAIPRDEQARATSSPVDQVTLAPQPPRSSEPAPPPSPPASTRQEKQEPRSLAKSAALPSAGKREEFEREDKRENKQDQANAAQETGVPVAQTPATGALAEARERDSDRPPAVPERAAVAPASPSAAAASRALSDTQALTARAFAASEIRSPNSLNRWRIVNAGRQLERSTSGGSQWETASLSSPGVMTAGMSPASSVCWIVGRAGAVYVTTDGLRFVRVMFPESIDLVSVTATDDRHATVMSADGRSFRTEDQGVTWTR